MTAVVNAHTPRRLTTLRRDVVRLYAGVVARVTGLRVDRIFEDRRRQMIVEARRLLIWLLSTRTGRGPTAIARALGLDHTTVVYHLSYVGAEGWHPDWRAEAVRLCRGAGL